MKERVCHNSDIKALKQRLLRARDIGNAGVRLMSESVADIESAIDAVSQPEGLQKLKTIPVEELNARKAGIRINLLRDAGYTDMYSICMATQDTLSRIYGIGDQMAAKAKEIARSVSIEVCNSVKLKISTDHKTEEYSRLVTAVAEHMRAKEILPKCEQVLAMLPSDIDGELEKLTPAKNGVKWFFTGGAKKDAATEAFNRLKAAADAIDASGLLMQINGTGLVGGRVDGIAAGAGAAVAGATGGAASSGSGATGGASGAAGGSGASSASGAVASGKAVLGLPPITIADAWADFANRPVEYYNILEGIAPDRFDSSEDGYGLSDEIRESVENTPVDLTGLKCTLRGYQIWGVKYILRQKRVLLGDEMGLGKTIQALAAMVSLRNGVPAEQPKPAVAEPAMTSEKTEMEGVASAAAEPAPEVAVGTPTQPQQEVLTMPTMQQPAIAPAVEEVEQPVQESAPAVTVEGAPAASEVQAETPVQESAPAAEEARPKRFLVICPASVIVNWCREVEAKSDLKAYNMHDAQRESAFRAWTEKGGVAVTNFESLESRFRVDDEFPIDMVIVDEAHYIKNIAAKRSQNVLKLCDHTDRILFMTGTPLENRVDEMVGLMGHLQKEVAQEAKSFSVTTYADDFKRKISPVYYRRRRNDVLSELPELTDIKEWCDMTKEDEQAYENDVLEGSFMDVRRVSWRNADYLNTSAKVTRLREIVQDAADDARKVLVFSFFLDTLEKVKTVFGESCIGVINGAVPVEERQNIVDAFEAAAPGSVLAAQIQSGGTGLNIQSASVVVLCEPQYKPSTENQAIGRAHRMGQTRDVLVHRLLCPNTVDERMLELVEAKQAEFDTFADESSAAERDADLEKSGVDVNQGVVVGEAVGESVAAGVAGAEAAVAAVSGAENGAAPVAEAVATKAAASLDSSDKGELDQASLNKIFADEKARILAKREREAQMNAAPEQAAPETSATEVTMPAQIEAAVTAPSVAAPTAAQVAAVEQIAAAEAAPQAAPQQTSEKPVQAAPMAAVEQVAAVEAPPQAEPVAPVETTSVSEVETIATPEVAQEVARTVLFCRYCGSKIPVDSIFCNQCGKDIR
ncbi:MAG: hypothetical protein J5750_01500 [Clostridiales bacterium]|nr:hypothetical protein [Clostridiales bacterium]